MPGKQTTTANAKPIDIKRKAANATSPTVTPAKKSKATTVSPSTGTSAPNTTVWSPAHSLKTGRKLPLFDTTTAREPNSPSQSLQATHQQLSYENTAPRVSQAPRARGPPDAIGPRRSLYLAPEMAQDNAAPPAGDAAYTNHVAATGTVRLSRAHSPGPRSYYLAPEMNMVNDEPGDHAHTHHVATADAGSTLNGGTESTPQFIIESLDALLKGMVWPTKNKSKLRHVNFLQNIFDVNMRLLIKLNRDELDLKMAEIRGDAFRVLQQLPRISPHPPLPTGVTDQVMADIVASLERDMRGEGAYWLWWIIHDHTACGIFRPYVNIENVLKIIIGILDSRPLEEFFQLDEDGDEDRLVHELATLVYVSPNAKKIPRRYRNLVVQILPIIDQEEYTAQNRAVQAIKCKATIGQEATVELGDIRRSMLALLDSLTGNAEGEYKYGNLVAELDKVWRALSSDDDDNEKIDAIVQQQLRDGLSESTEVSGDIDTPLIVAQKLLSLLDTSLAPSFIGHAHEWSGLMVQVCERAEDEATTIAALNTFPRLLESIKRKGLDSVMRMWRAQWKAVEKAIGDGVPGAELVQRRLCAVFYEATAPSSSCSTSDVCIATLFDAPSTDSKSISDLSVDASGAVRSEHALTIGVAVDKTSVSEQSTTDAN